MATYKHDIATPISAPRWAAAGGFTLMELTVVVILLAFMGMMVVPIFNASFSGARQEHSMRDLFAALKYAQSGAVTEATEYRVYFDPEKNRYWTAHAVFDQSRYDDGYDDPFEDDLDSGFETQFERDFKSEIGFALLNGRAGEYVELADGLKMDRPKARSGRGEGMYYFAFYPGGSCDVASIAVAYEYDELGRYTFATTGTTVEFEVPQS